MHRDMCVPCGEGFLNIRVGAIILREGKILMAGNEGADYLYSVGGRVKFGETAEEAVIREVEEETGVRLEVDRLGFVHENYFIGDSPEKAGKLIYELSLYFYMKVPADFEPVSHSFAEGDRREFLVWIEPDTERKLYPAFYRTELFKPYSGVQYLSTDER